MAILIFHLDGMTFILHGSIPNTGMIGEPNGFTFPGIEASRYINPRLKGTCIHHPIYQISSLGTCHGYGRTSGAFSMGDSRLEIAGRLKTVIQRIQRILELGGSASGFCLLLAFVTTGAFLQSVSAASGTAELWFDRCDPKICYPLGFDTNVKTTIDCLAPAVWDDYLVQLLGWIWWKQGWDVNAMETFLSHIYIIEYNSISLYILYI